MNNINNSGHHRVYFILVKGLANLFPLLCPKIIRFNKEYGLAHESMHYVVGLLELIRIAILSDVELVENLWIVNH